MLATALPEFSPVRFMATSSDFTPLGWSTDTLVFSFSISSGENIFQDNITLLIIPQEHKIHAIFGSCLVSPGICGVTKTQPQAKRKAAKNPKAKLVEDKKIAVAALKAKPGSKEKELLMSFAKAKASLAGSEVNELLPKLVEAVSAGSVLSQPHPHRK